MDYYLQSRGIEFYCMKKNKRIRNLILIFSITVLLILILFSGYHFIQKSIFKESITVEAGINVTPDMFVINPDQTETFAKDCNPFYPNIPGDYIVKINKSFFSNDCLLKIIDSVPPTAKPQPLSVEYGATVNPQDLVTDIKDGSPVSVFFLEPFDSKCMGSFDVEVILKDSAANETHITSRINVIPVHSEISVEAGSLPISLEDIVLFGEVSECSIPFDIIEYNHVNDYSGEIVIDERVYPVTVHIVDTIPPQISADDLKTCIGKPRLAEDFVTEVIDATDVTLSFDQDIDFSSIGDYDLVLTAIDEGHNKTVSNVHLSLEEDNEGPVFENTDDFTSFVGEPISFRRHIKVSDNSGEEPSVSIDASKVNNEVIGEYPVIYTATDSAGNSTTKEITVSITERTYTDDDVNFRIDGLIDQIITEDMDETAKARAVYDFLVANIEYTGKSEKNNFNKAVIGGLLDYKGDCFTNSAIAVATFKRLGMDAMIIKKLPIVTMYNHWWLIVKVDGQWYHMDTCPRNWDKPEIFLWTDSHMKEYSRTHEETHNFDRSLYPEIAQ